MFGGGVWTSPAQAYVADGRWRDGPAHPAPPALSHDAHSWPQGSQADAAAPGMWPSKDAVHLVGAGAGHGVPSDSRGYGFGRPAESARAPGEWMFLEGAASLGAGHAPRAVGGLGRPVETPAALLPPWHAVSTPQMIPGARPAHAHAGTAAALSPQAQPLSMRGGGSVPSGRTVAYGAHSPLSPSAASPAFGALSDHSWPGARGAHGGGGGALGSSEYGQPHPLQPQPLPTGVLAGLERSYSGSASAGGVFGGGGGGGGLMADVIAAHGWHDVHAGSAPAEAMRGSGGALAAGGGSCCAGGGVGARLGHVPTLPCSSSALSSSAETTLAVVGGGGGGGGWCGRASPRSQPVPAAPSLGGDSTPASTPRSVQLSPLGPVAEAVASPGGGAHGGLGLGAGSMPASSPTHASSCSALPAPPPPLELQLQCAASPLTLTEDAPGALSLLHDSRLHDMGAPWAQQQQQQQQQRGGAPGSASGLFAVSAAAAAHGANAAADRPGPPWPGPGGGGGGGGGGASKEGGEAQAGGVELCEGASGVGPPPPADAAVPLASVPSAGSSSSSGSAAAAQQRATAAAPQAGAEREGAPASAAQQGAAAGCTIKLRGLPYRASMQDIRSFFDRLKIAPNGIRILMNNQGRPSGEACVQFTSAQAAQKALKRDRQYMGGRYIEVFLLPGAAPAAGAAGAKAGARVGSPPSAEGGAAVLAPAPAGGARPASAGERGGGGAGAGLRPGSAGAGKHAGAPLKGSGGGSMPPAGGAGAARGAAAGGGRGGWAADAAAPPTSASAGAGGADAGPPMPMPTSASAPPPGGSSSSSSSEQQQQQQQQPPQPHVIKMRGLPYKASAADVAGFFAGAGVRVHEGSVVLCINSQGRPTGEANVRLGSAQEAQRAMSKDLQSMGNRYIELFDLGKAGPGTKGR